MPRSTLFPSTTLFRSIGAWIRLFREHGLVVEDLIEVRPPEGADSTYRTSEETRSEERFSRNAEIYTLSLHDALPIYRSVDPALSRARSRRRGPDRGQAPRGRRLDLPDERGDQIGRAVQQECRDLHSFPPRRSSDLSERGSGSFASTVSSSRT